MPEFALPHPRTKGLDETPFDLEGDRDLAFLLRSFRLWIIGLRGNAPDCWNEVWNDFAKRFGASEGKRALSALANVIKAIQLHARRRVRHHPPCCRYLAPDEASFLGFLTACQAGDWMLSRCRAEWLVRDEGIGDLLETGGRLAELLSAQGMTLPEPSELPRPDTTVPQGAPWSRER